MIASCDESHVEGNGKKHLESNGPTGKVKGTNCSVSAGNKTICRSVAPVIAPASTCQRISLPGVMDEEGRVDESRLRMYIFKNGGVSPEERGQVWRFLFGMYPCSSTALERPLLLEQMAVRYQAMKRKWQQLLPGAVCLRLNGTDGELLTAVKYFDQRQDRERNRQQYRSEEVKERLSFLELQAQVLFERVTFDLEELQEAIRIIDKDVPRTDRDLPYYRNEGLGNLLVLRDILITFAAFHPEVSYAQGMNDLCSRFLEVLDSEVDTYWSFSCYMEKFSKDFCADGLYRKMELEAALLKELDPQLHSHLVTDNMDRLTFCHRWLLLGFQREFQHSDALRLFEILSCDHLELISQQVDRARYRERLARKHSLEDEPLTEAQAVNTDFTFELFMCATILLENRDTLLNCRNEVQLIQFTSRSYQQV
ncbi:TBC1 domain family member 15-like isoform X2 [Myxocyprinus asiaticus]|uniref:TBC1 domain family member 15-like isoform X2 n=1 Tax=Myxocyprinus asiaticus TaxID=70543 RepID=UPI002222CADF|nr:TBC1 domain family member 15-like isoform X2 [Myxocyprinus asiaticus]